jgi:formate dehydrogenase
MIAEVDGGEVQRLVPDAAHPVSRGFACIKGPAMLEVHRDPSRLDHPERRDGSRWTRASWRDATADIGARIARIRAEHGPDAVGVYIGNPTAFNVGLSIYAAGFLAALGTRNFFNAASLDCQNKFAVAEEMFGHYVIQPIPDLDHTDFFLCLGSNPLVSQMSFVAMPRALERLKAVTARGGRVVFVNPRRTETAQAVGEQQFIRPDTDAFLLMGMLRVIFDEELEDREACKRLGHVEELRAATRSFALDDVAAATGIARDTIVELARSFARAPSANAYCSTGVNMGSSGSLAFLGVQALNAVTGNVDRAGGALVPSRAVRFAKLARLLARLRPPRPSRIGGFAPVAESLPTGILADEILTPGAGQIRALLCIAGNPLLSAPSGTRLGEALRSLDLLVSVDLYRNETGALAHWTLPATDWIEREDFPLVQSGMQPEPYAQLSPALVTPRAERRTEADILVDLARAAGLRMFATRGMTSVFARVPPKRVFPWVSRIVGLPPSRDPVLVAPDEPGAFLKSVPTHDGRIDVGPKKVLADVPRAVERCRQEAQSPPALRLIGRRQRRSHNSWMNEVPKLHKADDGCRLAIHPDDAARLGVADGARVAVTSATGRIEVVARIDGELMPGTVSMPHGWKVNVNLLAADGPAALEPLSGMVRYNGIEVDVTALPH